MQCFGRGTAMPKKKRNNLTLKMTVVVASGGSRRAERLCNRQSNHQSTVDFPVGLTCWPAPATSIFCHTKIVSLSAFPRAAVNLRVIKKAPAPHTSHWQLLNSGMGYLLQGCQLGLVHFLLGCFWTQVGTSFQALG